MRLFKKFGMFVTVFSLGFGSQYSQASPTTMIYQGSLKQSGALVNGTVSLMFSITNSDGSQIYWTSGTQSVSVKEGLYRVELSPTNVDWANIDPYIETRANGSILLPREKISNSPYAYIAQNVAAGATAPTNFNVSGDTAKLQLVRPSNGRTGAVSVVNSFGTLDLHGAILGGAEAMNAAVQVSGDAPSANTLYAELKPDVFKYYGDSARIDLTRRSNGRTGSISVGNVFGGLNLHASLLGGAEAMNAAVQFTGDAPVTNTIYGEVKPDVFRYYGDTARIELVRRANGRAGAMSITNGFGGLDFHSGLTGPAEVSNTAFQFSGDAPGTNSVYYTMTPGVFAPYNNGSQKLGTSTTKWQEVWAQNGVIQTSSSKFKSDIRELVPGKTGLQTNPINPPAQTSAASVVSPNELTVPRGIVFKWNKNASQLANTNSKNPDKSLEGDVIGFLGDDLPAEAHAMRPDGTRDPENFYTSSVIGILCAKVRAQDATIVAQQNTINDLVARVTKLEKLNGK